MSTDADEARTDAPAVEPGQSTEAPPPAAATDADQQADADWKAQARKWEERSKANADAARRLAEFEERHQAELEATAERVRAEERRSASERLAVAEIRAAAADRFHDPDDAARWLNPAEFVGDDGTLDTKELGRALDELLEKKPYLGRASQQDPHPFAAPQGPQGATSPDPNVQFRQMFG